MSVAYSTNPVLVMLLLAAVVPQALTVWHGFVSGLTIRSNTYERLAINVLAVVTVACLFGRVPVANFLIVLTGMGIAEIVIRQVCEERRLAPCRVSTRS
jgi:hypothetical protein